MVENIKDIGFKIKCMEEEFIVGKMEESMKDNINMIRSMVLEFILGLMDVNMKEAGVMD
jgi:hypothetical protein